MGPDVVDLTSDLEGEEQAVNPEAGHCRHGNRPSIGSASDFSVGETDHFVEIITDSSGDEEDSDDDQAPTTPHRSGSTQPQQTSPRQHSPKRQRQPTPSQPKSKQHRRTPTQHRPTSTQHRPTSTQHRPTSTHGRPTPPPQQPMHPTRSTRPSPKSTPETSNHRASASSSHPTRRCRSLSSMSSSSATFTVISLDSDSDSDSEQQASNSSRGASGSAKGGDLNRVRHQRSHSPQTKSNPPTTPQAHLPGRNMSPNHTIPGSVPFPTRNVSKRARRMMGMSGHHSPATATGMKPTNANRMQPTSSRRMKPTTSSGMKPTSSSRMKPTMSSGTSQLPGRPAIPRVPVVASPQLRPVRKRSSSTPPRKPKPPKKQRSSVSREERVKQYKAFAKKMKGQYLGPGNRGRILWQCHRNHQFERDFKSAQELRWCSECIRLDDLEARRRAEEIRRRSSEDAAREQERLLQQARQRMHPKLERVRRINLMQQRVEKRLAETVSSTAKSLQGGNTHYCVPAPASCCPYESLGLKRTAPKALVRKRYLELVLKFHPDKNPNKDEHHLFPLIVVAYKTLRKRLRI